jgi:energy-coupling factor transporter ATP-binding protein EcfA2
MKARDNPFRVARVLSTIRYEIPAGDSDDVRGGREGADSLLPRLEALRYRAAIVGPHGSGKTTLLEDLEGVLAERGFRIVHVRLDTDDPRLPREWWSSASVASVDSPASSASSASSSSRLDEGVIVCLDGAEQLGPIAWLRFRWRARRAGGLIVTTHRPGRLATLIECTTSAGLLHRIIRRLAPDVVDGSPSAPSAADLFARHRGNIREALRELYDVYADRTRHVVREPRL